MKFICLILVSCLSKITELDIKTLKNAEYLVLKSKCLDPLKIENKKFEDISNRLLKDNKEIGIMNPILKYCEISDIEKRWILSIFSIISKLEIDSCEAADNIIEFIGENIFSLTFIDDADFQTELHPKLVYLLNKLSEFKNQDYKFSNFINYDLKCLFIHRLNDSLDFFDHIKYNTKAVYTNYSNKNHHSLFMVFSAFIYCSTQPEKINYFTSNSLTSYLFSIAFADLSTTIILTTMYHILISTEVRNDTIFIVEDWETNKLSHHIIKKMLSLEDFMLDLNTLKSIINIKFNRIEDCIDIKNLVYFYFQNHDLQYGIRLYFLKEEEALLHFCIDFLFYSLTLTDKFDSKLEIFKYVNDKMLEETIIKFMNYYTYNIVKSICYFTNNVSNQIEADYINSLVNLLFHIINNTNSFKFYQISFTMNSLLNTFLSSNKGIVIKRNGIIDSSLHYMALETKQVSSNRYVLDTRKIYIMLIGLVFAENDILINNNRNEFFDCCFYKVMSLKLILKNSMENLGLYVCQELNNLDIERIECVNNDNSEMTSVLMDCIARYVINTDNISVADFYEQNDRNNEILNPSAIWNTNNIFIDINVTGNNIFIDSMNELQNKIEHFGGKIPANKYINIIDGSVARGDGVFKNWMKIIAEETIKLEKRYLFIECNTEKGKYMPCLLSEKAFELKKQEYRFIGQLIGLALKTNIFFEVEFVDFIYEFLLDESINIEAFIKTEFHFYFNNKILKKSFKEIKEEFKLNIIDHCEDEWEYKTIDIDFEYIILLAENKDSYHLEKMEKIIIHTIGVYLKRAIRKIREGFMETIDEFQFINNTSKQLKDKIFGDSVIGVDRWKELTKVTVKSDGGRKTAELFWLFIESSKIEYRREILKFWTGGVNFPKINTENIKPFNLIITEPADEMPYLKSSTCVNVLYLPILSSVNDFEIYFGNYDIMKKEAMRFNEY
ncbi:E3 ubiquitin-protein ligase hyd [Astathelohania contejeani]|uniref:HECT-type E3 ubiquitin transferase n=1 Tax=Astathelohania contejeani TaxID=164912 RepID=A0ABQ7HZ19_9MICR|nr:E3 ubiquitin-protein ligase hyd [Thelohania contejeani]